MPPHVTDTTPAANAMGLVVRLAGAAASGGLTDTELRATPVPVSLTDASTVTESVALPADPIGKMLMARARTAFADEGSISNGDAIGLTATQHGELMTRTVAGGSLRTSVGDSATVVTVLAAAGVALGRKGATVFNDSAAVLYLALGSAASLTDFTVKIQPDGYYEVPMGYSGIITGIWASDAGGSARITELVN